MTRYVVSLEQRLDGFYVVEDEGLTPDQAKAWAKDAADESSRAVSWEGGSIAATEVYEVGAVCTFRPLVAGGEGRWCDKHLSSRSSGDPVRCYQAAELERFAAGVPA